MQLSDKYKFLKNYFTTIFSNKEKSLSHCILFYGEDIEVQYAIAQELARLLNCKEDKDDNCDCLNCKWIREGTHPAVMTITKIDNKPSDDTSESVISIKQSGLIKELLITSSEFHRVFIFCDRDKDGKISGLNNLNFPPDTANSMLKNIEEPNEGTTFIFLTKNIEDVLSTIVSRSQCFHVPSFKTNNYDWSLIKDIFENYWENQKKDIFDISQQLVNLSKDIPVITILEQIQNYILFILKNNPHNIKFIKDIEIVEICKTQAIAEIKPQNIFDELCLKLIT